jgi:Na+:H+ antiporter, NhaA family
MHADDHAMPIDRLLNPLRDFAAHKLAGAGLLLAATAIALLWANSPLEASYHALFEMPVEVSAGPLTIKKSLLHWINDGLMGFFFFVIGLEIKREVLAGHLRSPRLAAFPIAGALGGMVLPALLYLALNPTAETAHGWGVPMATDIAFALGVLAVLGERLPVGLKVFLTALAIVDDIGAIVVIAVFYTPLVALFSLAAGGLLFALALALNRAGLTSSVAYFVLGTLVWLAFLKSGVHATLAAVLMAFAIPARRRVDGASFEQRVRTLLERLRVVGLPARAQLLTPEQEHVVDAMAVVLDDATAPLQRLEHTLVPIVTFLVLPAFALANAGVSVGGTLFSALRSEIALGVIVGLFVGKQAGILAFAWVAVRLGIADLPAGVTWRQVHGVATLGGVGFTMSLFIAALAFPAPAAQDLAKVGILVASLLSAAIGLAALCRATGAPSAIEADDRARSSPDAEH